jgi:hypothetical protein
MDSNTLSALLGNPSPEVVEERVQSAQAEYLSSKDPEKRNVLMDAIKGLLGVQQLHEEREEVGMAKTAVGRAGEQLAKLKASLAENERIVCSMDGGKSVVKWEIVGQNGESLGSMEDPSAIARAAKLDMALMERIGKGDRKALSQFRKSCVALTARKSRMESLRELVDHVSRMVADGTDLIVSKGAAKVEVDTRGIRQEINARLKLIASGKATSYDTKSGKMYVDGKEVLTFVS